MSETSVHTPDPPRVTIVTSTACHFCADAEEALAQIAVEHPIEIIRLDSRSEAGVRLMRTHRAAMSPLVLLEGVFVSSGRLPRGRLRKLLQHQQVPIPGVR